MKLFNKLSLKIKLFILGVLPAAILAIILSIYFTTARLNETYELLQEKERNIAVALSKASVYGVFSGNKTLLDALLKSVNNEPDILNIKITGIDGELLSESHKTTSDSEKLAKDSLSITQPIRIENITMTDPMDDLLVGTPGTTDSIIGYLTLTVSRHSVQIRQQEMLFNSFYITFFALTLIGFIAYKIGQTIGLPILRLANDVKQLQRGNFKISALDTIDQNEITTLHHGIHEMAYELENNQAQLERKVHEATQELEDQNLQLSNAQEKIIKAAEAKSTFISHISHEIRTPLNGIIGFLELTQMTRLNNEQRKLISASLISSKNLHQIIHDVLDLSQFEAGKVKLKKINLELKKVIDDVLFSLSNQATEKKVEIIFHQDADLPKFIYEDPLKLGQVIINLVSNAIKFSPNSTIHIKLKHHPSKSNHLNFSVIDTGIGISEENQLHLFDEFTQFDTRSFEQGSGLGLTISKHIMDALKGEISVESQLGKGSTFCFTLPYVPVKESSVGSINSGTQQNLSPELQGTHILVADDNEINRLLLTYILERQHAHVETANDGQQAAEMAKKRKYDLMLFDLRMPFKSGDQVLEGIRAIRQHINHNTPAIAVTAHVTSGIERANHINNFDGYLIKPIEQASLFKLITHLLSDNHDQSEPFFMANKEKNGIDAPLFDKQTALASMGNDPAVASLIINKFIKELPLQVNTLKKQLDHKEWSQAADTVHKIHGSAAYCGTKSLKFSAKEFENNLRNISSNNIDIAQQLFFKQVKDLLAQQQNIKKLMSNPLITDQIIGQSLT